MVVGWLERPIILILRNATQPLDIVELEDLLEKRLTEELDTYNVRETVQSMKDRGFLSFTTDWRIKSEI